MVRLENEPVISVHGRRPLTHTICDQRMPLPWGIQQVSETVGLPKQGYPHPEPGPAASKGTLTSLFRRALSLEPLVGPRDLDVSLRDAQVFNPWGYNSNMDS